MAGRERDITALLGELGLQRYAATFEDEDFTEPALLLSMRHDLRQPSLEELGMCPPRSNTVRSLRCTIRACRQLARGDLRCPSRHFKAPA